MKKNWMLIVGILFAVYALSIIASNIAAAIISLIIAGVFIFLWLKKKKAVEPKGTASPVAVKEPAKTVNPVTRTERPVIKNDVSDSEDNTNSKIKHYRVVGTSYYKDAFKRLAVENSDYSMSKKEIIEAEMTDENIYQYCFYPINVELVPEPDNPYDPNAIKVVVDGEHIGHIKKGNCAHLLKVISGNRIEKISAQLYGGKYKCVTSYEDYDEDKTAYEMESDTTEYGAKIEVIEKPEQ